MRIEDVRSTHTAALQREKARVKAELADVNLRLLQMKADPERIKFKIGFRPNEEAFLLLLSHAKDLQGVLHHINIELAIRDRIHGNRKRAEQSARQSSREQVFIQVCRETLPSEQYAALWAEVDQRISESVETA